MHYSFFKLPPTLQRSLYGVEIWSCFHIPAMLSYFRPLLWVYLFLLLWHRFPFCCFTPPRFLSYLESLAFYFVFLWMVLENHAERQAVRGSRKSVFGGGGCQRNIEHWGYLTVLSKLGQAMYTMHQGSMQYFLGGGSIFLESNYFSEIYFIFVK